MGKPKLLGGLEHEFYFSIYIYIHIYIYWEKLPTDFHIFQRGRLKPPINGLVFTGKFTGNHRFSH